MRLLRTKAWLTSAVLHVAAGLAAAGVMVPRIERDYITVSAAAPPLELELSVEFVSDEVRALQRVLDDAFEHVEIAIEPPDDFLQKPADEVTYEEIRELVRMSAEQAGARSPEEQINDLAWLLDVDRTIVSDESAAEITDKIEQALGVEEREFEPRKMAKISELDNDTVVPYYRVTETPSKIIQIIDINPNGDYRMYDEKPFHELYDVELDEYRRYEAAAADHQDERVRSMMRQENRNLEYTADTARHFRTISQPAGTYFQVVSVDAQGRYRIIVEKPKAEMTLLEWARLRAFQLTEDPRHKKYREAALGAAGKTD
jgi:hypothetical protein